MPDNVQDVRAWLREIGRSPRVELGEDDRKQLASVLNGPLMRPVVQALNERIEGMKDRAMSLELAKSEELAMMQGLQAETRGIIAVLEIMWEMANAEV